MQVENVARCNSLNPEQDLRCESIQLNSDNALELNAFRRSDFEDVGSICNNIARCIFLTNNSTTNKLINISVLPPTAKACGLPHRLER